MRALHTFRSRGDSARLDDFELFVMLLSALEWREHNGEIILYTDRVGQSYLEEMGLMSAWNEIKVVLDDMISLEIDEKVFWAGSKIFALAKEQAPCVIMDLDFILWKHIDFDVYGHDLAVIHLENICDGVYPPKKRFSFTGGWTLPAWLNWSVLPANGALVYHGGQRLLHAYTDFAIDFMRHAADHDDRLHYMVFIEQRWLSMCAKHLSVTLHEISSLENLFGGQKYFTHIWGYKQKLRCEPEFAEKFCFDCARRLRQDFPDFANKLAMMEWAAPYFKE